MFDLLNNGAHIYFCGLKGMMPGILEMLEGVCKQKGINFEEWSEKLKHSGQWCVVEQGSSERGGFSLQRLLFARSSSSDQQRPRRSQARRGVLNAQQKCRGWRGLVG